MAAFASSRCRTSWVSIATLLLVCISKQCFSYPLIAMVDEGEEKCVKFNIPQEDDAHMVFMALPSFMEESAEEWYVGQLNAMIKARLANPRGVIPKALLEKVPDSIEAEIQQFEQDHGSRTDNSGVKLNVQQPRRPALRHQDFKWFEPIVMNHVERTHQKHTDFGGGYSICFQNNRQDFEVHILFDMVLVSDYEEEDQEEEEQERSLKKEHLTPLEENLQESIQAAQSVLSEMRYMEKREVRMRHTADSINSKIRFFSYLSIVILLGVTYIQVTYLKRYFKKKKLM